MLRGPLHQGHAVVEFLLVFPVFFLMSIALFDLGWLAIQQMKLESMAQSLVRVLALSKEHSYQGLNSEAQRWLLKRSGFGIKHKLRIRDLKLPPPDHPLRKTKTVSIVELSLERKFFPHLLLKSINLPLKALRRDVKYGAPRTDAHGTNLWPVSASGSAVASAGKHGRHPAVAKFTISPDLHLGSLVKADE